MVRPEYDFRLIGRNLKRIREDRHMTVEDVRQYMQLGTQQAVYKWERGDGLPQADTLLALMELYSIYDFRELLEEGDKPSSCFEQYCTIPLFFLRSLDIYFSRSIYLLLMKHKGDLYGKETSGYHRYGNCKPHR